MAEDLDADDSPDYEAQERFAIADLIRAVGEMVARDEGSRRLAMLYQRIFDARAGRFVKEKRGIDLLAKTILMPEHGAKINSSLPVDKSAEECIIC